MDIANRNATNTADREIVVSRIIDAPRELVWKAWIDPEHIAQMVGPAWLYCAVVPMGGVFQEVCAPGRLVFLTNAMRDESGQPQLEVHNTVTFEEYADKTRLTLHAVVVKSTPAVAGAIAGMEQGWTQSLEKFAAHIEG